MNSYLNGRKNEKRLKHRKKEVSIVPLIFLATCLSSAGYAADALPAKLPDVNDRLQPLNINNSNHSTPTRKTVASADIDTPEYAIIRANDETTFSSETSGTVIKLLVKEGSNFKKGEVLLQLDCRLQEADYQKARAEQTAANKTLISAKKLKEYGSISELEVVKATSAADGANADAAKLAAIVEKCRIVAPFSGSVSKVKTHLYETVKPGDVLLQVTNTQDLFIEVQVPSNWLSWLHIGTSMTVHVNDIDKIISAKVNFINPAIDPISQTVKIAGQINPQISSLRPGMTGQVTFPNNPDTIYR